ncbi:MAG TPA: hypothetical protein PLH55_10375 [Spirochaetales bacterium]|nr:hypothetical protein [Spirochaetales bacterium]
MDLAQAELAPAPRIGLSCGTQPSPRRLGFRAPHEARYRTGSALRFTHEPSNAKAPSLCATGNYSLACNYADDPISGSCEGKCMFSPLRYCINLRLRIRRDKKVFVLYAILHVLVILILIRSIFIKNWEGVFFCALTEALFMLPGLAEVNLKIEVPTLFEGSFYIFIFAAEILGEFGRFYEHVPGWDTILHTINGFLAAAMGFSMIDLLNRKSHRVSLSPFFLCMVAFCFSMTIGVLWEFFEFGGDKFLRQDMQKDFIVKNIDSVALDASSEHNTIHISGIEKTILILDNGTEYSVEGGYLDIGIIDTMKDLFANFIGAIAYSILAYIYLGQKNKKKKSTAAKLAENLIVTPTDTDERSQMFKMALTENKVDRTKR